MSDDYGAFDVKQLWQMIDAAKQGLGPTREQITAWRRAQQMLDQHADALRGFRNQLAAKWPPESNAASAAYLTELDRLLHAVTATAQSSTSSAVHIGHAADAIEQAHATLQPLHDEYVRNEAKLASYQSQLDAVGTVIGAVDGSVIGGIARGATKLLTEPPVDAGRQEHLLRQAREAMAIASSAARDASTNLQPPPEYIPPDVRVDQDTGAHLWDESPGGPHRSASIGGSARQLDQSDLQPSPQQVSFPHSPQKAVRQLPEVQIPSVNDDVPRAPTHNPGPILSDHPKPVFSSHGPVLEEGRPEGPAINIGVPLDPIKVVPAWITGSPSKPMIYDSGWPQEMPTGAGGLGAPSAGMSSIHRGIGIPNPDQARTGALQKINPVGGIVGQSGSGVIGLPPLSGQSSGEKKSDGARWDPDNPWAVEQGVAPVIMPDPVRAVDPGPGIIGRDR